MNINLTILGEVINFAILIWCCKKYIWPPIKNNILEREKQINNALTAAKTAKKELYKAKKESKYILCKAKNEADLIIENAQSHYNYILEKVRNISIKESEVIIKKRKKLFEEEMLNRKKDLHEQLIKVSLIGLEKILEKSIDININKDFFKNLVKQI
ncbi:ATP synthase subunit b [Candidatus Portiera aleyrodidarum]|uniref:ATP synthase subunit b n=1 Tax=Candidatus Portiera aleyrodidarum TV TaxID=1297582 RepID=A0A8D3X938_9GAMM|nr:F0F1 ATP synthase subunit B [Candidatus Portiera aleyrodidarum]AGI27233.1 ATP synthase F0, B subunit [Candidatus Portiera aleyrodidarum TV]CEI59223.1 ATP synthase subunit b [Candidatus Portiera aleyrodidarum]